MSGRRVAVDGRVMHIQHRLSRLVLRVLTHPNTTPCAAVRQGFAAHLTLHRQFRVGKGAVGALLQHLRILVSCFFIGGGESATMAVGD